ARLLSEFSGVPISFDLESFDLLRASTAATLGLSLTDATVGEALAKLAEVANWTPRREEGQIVLAPKDFDPTVFVEEEFDVADLLNAAGDEDFAEYADAEAEFFPARPTREALEAAIYSLVSPASWERAGGEGALSWRGDALVAYQSAQNRRKIVVLLEQLRNLRGLESQSALTPEEIVPEPLAWDALAQKITFNPLQPTPLQNAIEILESSAKFPFEILWDDATLNESGVDRGAATTIRATDASLDAVLTELLAPSGLTYVVLTDKLLLITTQERAESYKTTELHFFASPGEARLDPESAATFLGDLRRAVAPKSWRSAQISPDAEEENGEIARLGENGESPDDEAEAPADAAPDVLAEFGDENPNAIWVDLATGALIVRQSQPNQRAIRRWLKAREDAKAANGTPARSAAAAE
ncbi:MAG: hypothetical protein HUK22_02410, partial [Thermoguttaceae bacterium]|nr:hypothetical protein [Thermoguttaceae bacterium]